jgi:uncharacterized protein
MKQAIATIQKTAAAILGKSFWKNPTLRLRAILWYQGIRNHLLIEKVRGSAFDSSLARALDQDEHFFGVLMWPLVDARWTADRRLSELLLHYQEVDSIGNIFSLRLEETRTLLNFEGDLSALSLCIEWQSFFRREGQLALSLFNGTDRVFSVAFLLSKVKSERVAYVGAVQGVKQSQESDLYKNITKAAHGLRPRDLIIALFLILCEAIEVKEILAVQDCNRQHRHAYFGRNGGADVLADYDIIWGEQDAELNQDGFFSLLPGVRVRDIDTIPSKKRSMYRKRYEFLNGCLSSLRQAIQPTV